MFVLSVKRSFVICDYCNKMNYVFDLQLGVRNEGAIEAFDVGAL